MSARLVRLFSCKAPFRVPFEGVVSQVKSETTGRQTGTGGTADATDEDDGLELATRNEEEVRRVRDVAKRMMLSVIVSTSESLYDMPSGAGVQKICYQATEHVIGFDRLGLQEYIERSRLFIIAEGKLEEKRVPVSEKLNRVKGHLREAMQKVTMAAYFKSLDVDFAKLTQEVAHD